MTQTQTNESVQPWFARYLANAGAGYALKAVQMALSLIAIPVLLLTLGEVNYGWLIFLSTTVGYFGILNLGISDSMAKFISQYHAGGDTRAWKELITTVVVIFGTIGGVIAIVLVAITAIPWGTDNEHVIKPMLCLTGLLYVFAWPMLGLQGVFVGLQRQPFLSTALGLGRIVAVGSAIYAAYLDWNLIWVFLLFNCDKFFIPFVLLWRIRTYLGGLPIRRQFFSIARVKSILGFSRWIMFARIATFLEYQVDTLLILLFVGPAGIAVYTVICTPFRMVQQVSGIAAAAIVPVIAAANECKDKQLLLTTIRTGVVAHNAMVSAVCVLFFMFSNQLFDLWLRGRYSEHYWLMSLLILFQTIWQSGAFLGYATVGKGHSRPIGIIAITTGVLNFAISINLVNYIGLYGVIYGTLIAGVIMVPFAIQICGRLNELSAWRNVSLITIGQLSSWILYGISTTIGVDFFVINSWGLAFVCWGFVLISGCFISLRQFLRIQTRSRSIVSAESEV